jgi:hypothetical protein
MAAAFPSITLMTTGAARKCVGVYRLKHTHCLLMPRLRERIIRKSAGAASAARDDDDDWMVLRVIA